ncbi:MAG: PD40 domain-containing protein [Bacteroidaceae bacterium]|nr:PD40 domain-containing protein [Bacteroidaceae bacterium]
MKNYILNIFVILAICSCSVSKPENAEQVNELPSIYPDYIGVTIPVEIAPLDFDYNGGEFETMYVLAKGSKSGELEAGGTTIDFDLDDWHELTRQNQGGEISMTVYVKQEGKWKQYQDFKVFVSNHPLEEWGLTYRRIAPGYEVYGKLGLYQRDLSTFEETPIIENTYVAGACFNCHTSNRTNPDQFTFHVRGDHGATMVQQHGNREWLKARNDSLHGSMVYPYWHPSGKYCAYSTNQTHQSFHAVRGERIEVFDQASDVFVYNPNTHELLLDKRLMTPDHYETYPVFSPDGKTLYFCSSDAKPIPSEYKEIRYNICKIDFNAENGTYGEKIDTVFHASALGKSATHPRPSYDGKYLMFTLADYGCFPIWHNEADNYILNLQTGEAKPLTEANSPQTDSWHNWNVNSHWFVFTSRRGNGLYTRLYLAHIDDNGNVSKPFLLPQRNPAEYYDALIDSYNTPDFTARKVEFDTRSAAREISSDERITTKVK